ncbi:MAG: putative phage terminase large subunit-like protein, partial [Myxococcota bacterium]
GLRRDQNAKKRFDNEKGGTRQGYPWGADFVGVDADGIFIDDPNDVDAILNSTAERVAERMLATTNTYEDKVLDRLNSHVWGYVILIMQRLDTADLAAHMIEQGAPSVCLPTEFEPDHPNRYRHGTQWHPDAEKDPRFRYPHRVDGDWRTEHGELLNPARLPRAAVERRKKRPRGWRAKHQQHPLKLTGGQIKREWFQTYTTHPESIARTADEVWVTVDAARKGKPNSDFHSMQVWARCGVRYYLIDRICRRMAYPEFKRTLDGLHEKWAWCRSGTLIEDHANGSNYLQEREGEITCLLAFDPLRDTPGKDRSKAARAIYIERTAEAKQVYVPAPSLSPEIAVWVEEWQFWVCAFPGGKHDDDVDACSQLIMRWELEARSGGSLSDWNL